MANAIHVASIHWNVVVIRIAKGATYLLTLVTVEDIDAVTAEKGIRIVSVQSVSDPKELMAIKS